MAPESWPPNPAYDRGMDLAETGDWAAALPHLRAAVEAQPGRPRAVANLGAALQQTGELEDAVAMVVRATELDPEDAYVWFRCADAQLTADHYLPALEASRRSVALEPDGPWAVDARLEGLRALIFLERLREACREGRALTRQCPGEPEVWRVHAIGLVRLRRLGEALQAIQTAERLAPERADLTDAAARIRQAVQVVEGALPAARAAAEEGGWGDWRGLGELLAQLGRAEEAAAAFATARERHPEAPLSPETFLSTWEVDRVIQVLEERERRRPAAAPDDDLPF